MFIDTHCHLNFHAFQNDLPDIVRRAKGAGVEKIIVPGTDLSSSRKAVEIAEAYPGFCYAAVGIHPHHAQDPNFKVNTTLREQLEELIVGKEPSYEDKGKPADAKAMAGTVVAVGEIGLDYYRYTKTKYSDTNITDDIKQKQKELFLMQVELALIHNKPLILHCREAHDDMIQTISRTAPAVASGEGGVDSPTVPVKTNYIKGHRLHGVWHCFGGSAKQLQDIVTMGYYVGFDGNITYSTDYSPLVASAPLERILLETDSPYLTPVPHRGTRNEPSYISFVAEKVANYHGTPLSKVTEITTKNALALFDLK